MSRCEARAGRGEPARAPWGSSASRRDLGELYANTDRGSSSRLDGEQLTRGLEPVASGHTGAGA